MAETPEMRGVRQVAELTVQEARRRWAQHEEDRKAEAENARLLARDDLLYGTSFTDVTGKRIDPSTIRPTNG